MHKTIIDALSEMSEIDKPGFTFLDNRLEPYSLSWTELAKEVHRHGHYFRNLGIEKGCRVGILTPDQKDFVLCFLGALTIGAIPVPIVPPFIMGMDSYLNHVANILHSCEASHLITVTSMLKCADGLKERATSLPVLVLDQTENMNSTQHSTMKDIVSVDSSDICFIQFTSGSTASPKGVVVKHGNLYHNAQGIYKLFKSNPSTDVGVSWLPMFHDMGLIAFVLKPIMTLTRCIYIPTPTFALRPWLWLETVNKYRGTFTASNGFGIELVTKYSRKHQQLDLSCLRVIVVGAEPINPDNMRSFNNTFRHMGLKEEVITPAYGMAETTLAITSSDPEQPFRTVLVDRDCYENEGRIRQVPCMNTKGAIEVISCGKTMSNHDMAIMDDSGILLSEGQVGEVVFKGPSVTDGYYNSPSACRELFFDGWMKTGDLGFILDGELFISSRKKDLVILAGRNYYPQTIEWSVEKVRGIRPGNVVAFSIPGYGTEQLVIVAEYGDDKATDAVIKRIREIVSEDTGVLTSDIVLIKPRTIPKTSSGKLKRRETKKRYEFGKLERIDGYKDGHE